MGCFQQTLEFVCCNQSHVSTLASANHHDLPVLDGMVQQRLQRLTRLAVRHLHQTPPACTDSLYKLPEDSARQGGLHQLL